jgi:hypothetical protein
VVTGLAFTRDAQALVVANEGPTVPPRLSRFAFDTGRTGPLLPAVPADGEALVEPTLHRFAAEDGLALTGWLFRPRGALGALPTLLWLHGGPEAQERPTFQPLFQALLAEGVAVFAPNVRGSIGYGRTFAAADDLDRRFVAITDVRAAVDFLVGAGLADPARIGVSGRSYGGYLTLVRSRGSPSCSRWAWTCAGSPTSPPSTTDRAVDRRRRGHEVRRPAGRRGAAAGALADPPQSTGSPHRCGGARGARHQRAARGGRAGGGGAARAGGVAGFLLFDDEATRCTAPRTGGVRPRGDGLGHRAPAGPVEQTA